MNISSTPFIRNDYWPDQNDINELNKRIDEAENETSLVNSRLSNDIENVSANLNSYISNQANTTIANNIIVNSLNANYATGKFANFANTFTNNAYVENLTVNKPVFDITLNTPHIENVTSLGGNIYDANMFNVSITGGNVAFNSVSIEDLTAENATISNINIQSGHAILNTINVDTLTVNNPVSGITLNAPNIENVTSLGGNISDANILNASIAGGNATLNSVNTESLAAVNATISNVNILDGDVNLNKAVISDINASNATILNLFVNTEPGPITSSAVLGYDSDGRVIPIHASYDVSFPENANYLFTDQYGTAIAGTAATAVGETDNLITSFAVKNAIDIVNESFNTVNNVFNDIGSWQNTFENSVANSFNNVNNKFNVVNSSIASSLNNVNNAFNNVNNKFNVVNSSIASSLNNVNNAFNNVNNKFNVVNNKFNDVNNKFNDVNNTFNNVNSYISGSINNVNNTFNNVNNSFNSVNNTTNNISDNVDYLKTALAPLLSLPVANVSGWTSSTSPVNIKGITEFVVAPFAASAMTGSDVGNGVKLNVSGTKATLALPNLQWTMKNMYHTFMDCSSLNQNILIPDGVTDMKGTFQNCTSLNQNIRIPNSVIYVTSSSDGTFRGCTNLNQNILLPNDLSTIEYTFCDCTNLNQNIRIPNNAFSLAAFFQNCTSLNQNIRIPNRVHLMTSTFNGCTSLNQNILIPNSVNTMAGTFRNCTSLNQNILIPSSVKDDSIRPWEFQNVFNGCTSLNQPNIYIYSQNIHSMTNSFRGCHINNVHIPTSVPKSTSNAMYNCLVNGSSGITFPATNIFNDLPVDIRQWPPV